MSWAEIMLSYLERDELAALVSVVPADAADLAEFKVWAEERLGAWPDRYEPVHLPWFGSPHLQRLYGLLDHACQTMPVDDQRWGMFNMLRTAVGEADFDSLLRMELPAAVLADGGEQRSRDLGGEPQSPGRP